MSATLARINALGPDAIKAALSGTPAEVARFVAAAAEAGSAEAQARYGQMLLDGHGVATDARSAFHWFALAAAQDHLDAINMVGRCYDLGWGVAVDKARAAEWFRAAACRGLHWGMYNYATALALGAGVPEDKAEALLWFERAAAQGNAKALNFIGSFHEDGWVVPRDLAKAAAFYRRAAEGRDFRGCFNHARMLLAKGNRAGARNWIDRAMDLGNDRFRAQVGGWLLGQPAPR